MPRPDENSVSIQVIGKEFLINCPPEAQAELMLAAKSLDQRMREIKSAGRVYGLDRIAVMAALNLSYELQQTQRDLQQLSEQLQQQHSLLAEQTAQLEQRVKQALVDNTD